MDFDHLDQLSRVAHVLETRLVIVRVVITDLETPPLATIYRGAYYATEPPADRDHELGGAR